MKSRTSLIFAPHPLFLSQRAAAVRARFAGQGLASQTSAGQRLTLAQALPLRDDVSTDEITPLPVMVNFDAALGRYAYTGFSTEGEMPIARDALRGLGVEVVVAGKRYGKGSSREHSVVAEMAAGVRLVVAESFERIYRQNADNLGLFTSTDFGLIARIQAGEAIDFEELLASRDALTASILRHGGLLAYGKARLGSLSPASGAQKSGSCSGDSRPRTLFEKIIDRHTVASADTPAQLRAGQGGFVRADWRFIHEYYTGMCAHALRNTHGDALQLHEPASILAFEDHLSYVHRSPAHVTQGLVGSVLGLSRAHRAFVEKHQLKHHGYLQDLQAGDAGNTGSEGISHALMAEAYALPGQLIVGTDSHTPHSGALGCLAFGVGTTDMANAFVTGAVRLAMPEVLRIELMGTLPPGVSAKDVALHLLALPALRAGLGVGKVFEFAGNAIRAMRTDERATLTNMTAEMGGFTGMVEPDHESVRFLFERRGLHFVIEPWMCSDALADYAQVLQIDVSQLTPMVARPGDPGRGVALSDVLERPKFDIAYGGSCTAGKRDDFAQYHAVLAWAATRGLRVAPHTQLYLQFGTQAVRDDSMARGYLASFAAVGAQLLEPACGACANCGPGSSELTTQVSISATNRNFPGRSGPGQVWLASPATVAASAIAGELCSFEELRARALTHFSDNHPSTVSTTP